MNKRFIDFSNNTSQKDFEMGSSFGAMWRMMQGEYLIPSDFQKRESNLFPLLSVLKKWVDCGKLTLNQYYNNEVQNKIHLNNELIMPVYSERKKLLLSLIEHWMRKGELKLHKEGVLFEGSIEVQIKNIESKFPENDEGIDYGFEKSAIWFYEYDCIAEPLWFDSNGEIDFLRMKKVEAERLFSHVQGTSFVILWTHQHDNFPDFLRAKKCFSLCLNSGCAIKD